MSDPNQSWVESWRLRALAKSMSGALRQRCGTKKFYTVEEVESACTACNVPGRVVEYAVAMFVEPEQSEGILRRLDSSKTVHELRKFMAQQIFFYYLPDASFDPASVAAVHSIPATR